MLPRLHSDSVASLLLDDTTILVGTLRIELGLHPYQGCVLTVILCSYFVRLFNSLVLTARTNDLTDHSR